MNAMIYVLMAMIVILLAILLVMAVVACKEINKWAREEQELHEELYRFDMPEKGK